MNWIFVASNKCRKEFKQLSLESVNHEVYSIARENTSVSIVHLLGLAFWLYFRFHCNRRKKLFLLRLETKTQTKQKTMFQNQI